MRGCPLVGGSIIGGSTVVCFVNVMLQNKCTMNKRIPYINQQCIQKEEELNGNGSLWRLMTKSRSIVLHFLSMNNIKKGGSTEEVKVHNGCCF